MKANNDIIHLLIENEEQGVTVRQAQSALQISAKSALNLLQQFGKPHVYKGTGISYILKDREANSVKVKSLISMNDRLEPIREQILDWLHQGNVDIEAWANDPLKRPPSYFVRPD